MASETDWLTKYPEAKQESWLDKYPEATEKPFFDLSDTLSATGRAFTSLGTSVPASMRQAFGGLENPWQRSEGYAQSRADMQALQQELEASDAAAMAGGDASSVSSSIREATPSLGFSGSTLVPSLAAGAVTALATKSPLAARSAAAGTSLLMAYRMAGAQFLDDSRERIDNFFQEKLQRPLTPEEQNEAYEELLPLARKFGAAEAGPEALGNMALGGAGKYIRKALGGKNGIMSLASNALSKVTGAKAVGAGVGAAAGEVGTEAITAVEQDRINKEFEQSVLRGEAPESVVLPDRTVQDYTQGITNVAPTTLAMTGLTGLAGLGPTAINRGYRALRPQAEQQVVETEIVPEEPAISPGLTAAVNTADSIVTTAENTSSDVSQATTAARNIIQGVVNTPQPQVAPAIELPAVTPSPAMEMPEKTSQTITDSNGEIAPEMSVLPPTVQAGAGAGEAIQPQPIETAPDAIIQREIPENRVEERLQIDEGGPSAAPSSGNRFIEGGQIQEEVAPPITPQGTPTPATETLGVTAPPAPEVDTSETPPRAVNAPLDPADKQIDAPIAAKNGYVVFERPDGKRYKLRDNSKTPPEWQNAEGKKVMLKGFGTRIGNSFLLQPQSKNSDYNEKAPVGDTVYHLYEEDSGRGLGNMSATELFQTGWTFVEEVKPAEAPPITPKGEAPTPATEGTVMPGGSAIERDVEFSVDEQLLMHSPFTNEDSSVSFRGVMPDGDAVVWSGKTQMKVPSAWLRRAGEPLPISANKVGDVPISVIDQESQPDSSVTVTTDRQQTLPIPKTKDGLIAEMVGPIKTDYVARQAQQKLINNYKKFSKDELLDMVKDQRARDAEFKRRQEATLAIIEQIKEPVNNAGTGWVRSIKDIAKSNGIDDYSILQGNSRGEEIYRIAARIADRGNAFVNPFQESPQTTTVAAPTETAAPSAKEAAVASVVQQPVEGSIPTVEQESAITAIESTEKTDIANAAMSFLEEDLTAQQRKVWTPEMFTAAQAFFDSGGKDFDSLKKAIKFPRVVQQAYLKADKEAAAEQTRREAADAAMAREVEKATKEQAKLEADQKQREELGLKTLNSLIEKTRTNVVQGTVKSSDANQAVAILNKSGAIPNVLFTWIGTSKDFLADPANRARYPETWKAVSSNPNIEGMSENGQPIVFTDNVGVSDLDRNLAKLQGTTPEVAAVRRVILHENIHKGMFFLSLKDKMKLFQFLHRLYSPEELDQLAKSYDEYSDWRINQVSYFSIIEEAMTRDFDSMAEIPRDGIWAEFMQFLRDIWQKITGKTSEPTLKNYKDVFRLIRNSLKNSEAANADRLKNGGGVRMSMSEFISNVTPEQDAAYAKAVADGDMETAQRMVDAVAKAAGLNGFDGEFDGFLYHATPASGEDLEREGVRAGSYWGTRPIAEYYAETIEDDGQVATIVKIPIEALDPSLLVPDQNGISEPLTFTLKKDEETILRDWRKTNKRWIDSLNLIGSIQYEGVVANRLLMGESADPVTRDEAGNVIPLSRRFQSASNDIRFSKVEYDSPNEAAFNSGAEVARNSDYDERDKAVRSTIRAAYDLAPKDNGPSVPIDQLFDIAKQSMPDLTENEFSQILQDLYEDSGALLQAGESLFSIFNNEGERAGSVIVMPPSGFQTRAMASIVDSPATNEFTQSVDDINNGTAKAAFSGRQFKDFKPIDRTVKSAEEYSDVAIKYVNNLEKEGVSLEDIANSVISPVFLESIGIEQDLMAQDALTIEVRQRVDNASRKEKSPGRKKQLSKLSERLSAFWQGVGSKKGQHLGQRRYLVNKARYSWMFIRELAEKAMKEARTNILISNFGSENATSFTQNSYENADMASTVSADEVAKDTINDTEWDLIKEGEQVFDGARKTIWERVKFLVARIALYARAEAAEIKSASKASFTDAQRDELASILTMPKAEREKAKAKDLAELDSLMAKLLGEESPTDTPTEKKKRNKRKEIIDTVEKRVKAGEPIEAPDYVPIITENPQRDEIIDDVANSLLQVAKNRGIKPSQKTALADLVASIKSLLKKNIKGEDLKADEVPLGQLLARTYLDNLTATEAKLFAQSWNRGRDKVRKMLAETGLEGAALEAELSAIMPATPTIAYNPSAVRKAITRALREATLDANDLLANPKETKAEILKVWDKAAVDAGLSPENWQEGRKLAEKSINEFIIERKAAKERSKQIAIAVVEQSKNPASLADFSNSLAQFKIKPDKVRELFDQAKLLAKRRVQIANDKAIRVLFEAENKLAQSAFFNSATKPDTIVKAFRDQISDPMDRKAFKDRLMAMEVTSEMADRLFDKAARTKDNAQWKRAQDMLEGPNALRNILREINRARPGDQAPLSKQIPWRELLSQNAKTVEEYRQRIFDAISANEELKSATPEQKARLADLFAEAWEANRTRILDGMLERMIRSEEAKKNLSKEGAKALQEQRMRIVEDINLGIFDNDELAKRMAEKFGVKSEFTEMEREKINSLIEVLQDEGLNAVKRQVAAYKLLEVLQGELKIPVAKMLADFWVSSVLSGPNTIVSIGLAVASGAFELSTALSRVFIAGFTNQKQLPSELAGAYKTLARLLSAFGRQANIAWQYLVTGDPAFLDPSMNDVTENMQWGNIGKSNKLAEQMAKSDKILVKSAGLFMRTVSRLLTALDVFNSGLTKEGSLSIVFRQIGLDPEKIAALEKKSDLKPYKDAIIQKDFGGTPPKSARDKAIVDSYALSDMMAELDKLGNVSENANFFGQQGAMTLDPSGLGGVGYRAIRSLVTNFESGSDRFLKKAQRGWSDSAQNGDQILSGLELALAYALQFLAYNAANFGGVRFARFAGNKFNQGLSFIPGIGFARAFEAEFDPDRIKAKEAFIDSIQRNQLVGVILSIGGYYILKAIADEPDDEKRGWFINGGWGNLTPEKKQQKLAAGEKEYTIGINGKVFNYANWPISSALAAIGSLSDLIRFSPDQWKDKNVTQIMASAAMSGAAAAADIPALSQFQELFGNSLSSKDPNEKRMERFAKVMSSYAGGFVPRFLKDIDYSQDPNLRKYETLWEKTASHIPIYRRYEGKEYYDILGQQIQRNVYPGSREFMTKPTDPAYKVLGALISRGIWLTPANAEHRMVGKGARRRSLTQEEADNYSLETGKGYKQMLLRYGQRALQMPTERAKAFLLDKADDVRDRALKKVYRGYTPAS